ncbi:MAG: hypothetical protein HYV60_07470, partial [Planctomycetia bacterium]|nr:hypothetical protein [Planctomycetia bacterium]
MNRPFQTVQVICPQCQATLNVPATSAGTTITCSECLEDFKAKPVASRAPAASPPRQPNSVPVDDALQRLLNPDLDASPSSRETIRLEDDSSDDIYHAKKKRIL